MKKSGDLRLIVDGRCANTFFLDPFKVQLCSGDPLSRLELNEGDELVSSSCDIRNAFYNMGLPVFLRNYFRLPTIKSRGRAWGKNLQGRTATARMRVLPMGFSWAVLFAQRIIERAPLRAGVNDSLRIPDFRPVPLLPRPVPPASDGPVCDDAA